MAYFGIFILVMYTHCTEKQFAKPSAHAPVGLLPLAKNAQHSSSWRAGASQPSPTTGTIFLYIIMYIYWRAGASQPSRTTGTIFLYIMFAAGVTFS